MEKNKNNLLTDIILVFTAPLAIMVIVLLAYKHDGAYPFGSGTIAWGDMVQQVAPLLIDFKDILAGKDGVFLNFANASGMNMWAVIFFFLASPFSFLTVFVKKTDMLFFVNILVMLKLMVCGGTASLYLRKTFPKLDALWVAALGVLYGMSGYGLLYYQNIIWLDMMYLFPLLLLALERLLEKKRVLPYTLVLAAMMTVNYYIGYMVVIFIMLAMGLALAANKKGGETAVRFVVGSFMAALLTAAVWLPSLIQYTKSGRVKEEFFSTVDKARFLSSYETILPTVLCSAFVLTIVVLFTCDGKPRSKKQNNYLILAALSLIPLFIEPINVMWHTGSYMSFPSRYGFITEFLLVVCAAAYLDDSEGLRTPKRKKYTDHPVLIAVLPVIALRFILRMLDYVDKHREKAGKYTSSLWGDSGSLSICVAVFFVMASVFTLLLLLYRKGVLSKRFLAVLCAALIVCEAYGNVRIYMTTPIDNYPERAVDQNKVYDMADRIDDNGMFRVKTDKKLFYVNLVGALGYGSISHYTSLNDQDYMFTMKRLGYSSNWMDVGSYGGTELTDLLMSIKYRIVSYEAENSVYSNCDYSIVEAEHFLPSGLVLDDGAVTEGELPDVSRGELQKFIYDNTLAQYGDEDAVKVYTLTGTENGRGFMVHSGESYSTVIDVVGRQTLYFDAFDKPEVRIGSDIDKSFDVFVNGSMSKSDYPNGDFNGLWKLGEFEDEQVVVSVNAKQDKSMHSLGVTAIDTDALYAAADNAQTVGFTRSGGRLSGSVSARAGQCCLINVPYSDGLRVRINGKSVPCKRVLGDLTAVELNEGENSIVVSAVPKGMIAGAVLSFIGAALCVLWHFLLGRRLKAKGVIATVVMWMTVAASAAVFVFIYVVPVIRNMTYEEK